MIESSNCRKKNAWAEILTLALTTCVILNKLLNPILLK